MYMYTLQYEYYSYVCITALCTKVMYCSTQPLLCTNLICLLLCYCSRIFVRTSAGQYVDRGYVLRPCGQIMVTTTNFYYVLLGILELVLVSHITSTVSNTYTNCALINMYVIVIIRKQYVQLPEVFYLFMLVSYGKDPCLSFRRE